MKTIKNKIGKMALVAMAIFSLSSCKKTETVSDTKATSASFITLQKTALNSLVKTANFNAETGTVFISPKGVTLTIPANAVKLNGTLVTGSVQLQYAEIFDAGNMAAANRSTMAILPNGDKALLNSGGEFEIKVVRNGVLLELVKPMTLDVPAPLTDSTVPAMELFDGIVDAKNNIDWQKVDPFNGNGVVEVVDKVNPVTGTTQLTYSTLVNKFGWTNIDRFYSDPRPKTTMLVSVPEGYNNDNCALYLKYVGEGSSLARLDTYNPSTKLFSEHYGQIPVGLACHLIFCTEENGKWKYATKEITISAGATYTISASELTTATQADWTGHITLLR